MSTIQIRIDEKTKKSAKKVLDEVGIDMSSAITVYLKQIVIHKGIPLKLITENGLVPDQEIDILNASAEGKMGVHVTQPMSIKESIDYLKKL